jgi:hypothetical protein
MYNTFFKRSAFFNAVVGYRSTKKIRTMSKKITKQVAQAKTSPKGGQRGCLCKDGKTYSIKCCDGSLQAQGIGAI